MNLGITSPSLNLRWLHRLDRAGSVLSTLCAVHCLCMPVVVALLPVLASGFLASRAFERTMCVSMVALASLCVWRGCRVHGRWPLLGLLAAGAATTLTVQWFAPPVCCAKERADWTEAGLMCAGGLAIAAAHLLNLRYTRRCACCPAITPPATP